MKPRILSKRLGYKCEWLKVEEAKLKLPNGKITEWQKLIIPDFVAIVALDKKTNIYLVEEWRLAFGKKILQIPAGGCESKNIIKEAKKELMEEIGMNAKKWQNLITCPLASRQTTKLHILLARDLFEAKRERSDEEIIEVVKLPFKKALKLFFSEKIPTTSYTILGMLLAKEKLKL